MGHQESSVEIFEKFTWKIENFSRLKTSETLYSEPFVLGSYPWRILLFPKGNQLSIFLESMKTANMSKGWSRDVKFKLLVFNQLNDNMTIMKGTNHEFNASGDVKGFESFMWLTELCEPSKGFIVKDICIVGAAVYVCKAAHEKQVNQAASLIDYLTSGSQTRHKEVEVPTPKSGSTKHDDAELFSPSTEELMDFTSVGQLEEISSHNPSLIDRPPKRSRKFTELGFAALGRVLCFLKTRKVQDINDQSCKDLQVLWEELEKFKFDLTWLEPRVQSALGMKRYVEKALQVEKLKENMVVLELETQRLKTKLVAAELNLDVERHLLKEKGLKVRDLDSKLG